MEWGFATTEGFHNSTSEPSWNMEEGRYKNAFREADGKLTINWWHTNKTLSLQGSGDTVEEYEKRLYGLISKEKSQHEVSTHLKRIQKHTQTRNQEKQQITNSNNLHLQNKHHQQ